MVSDVAALYCRTPRRQDPDPVGIDVQEALGVAEARRLGLDLPPRCVYIDHRGIDWQRGRPRAGWDGLLSALRAGGVGSVLLYRPESLASQSFDLAELFALADERGITLHGFGADSERRDAAFWAALRNTVETVCATRSMVSAAAQSAHIAAAVSGRPHGGGRRPYGYTTGMGELVAAEAAIVAEIFDRFVEGASLRSIAQDLNARGVPTSTGKSWSVGGIGRIVDAPRYAGLRVRHGEVVAGRTAVWPPCVDVDVWERARALRRGAGQERPRHVYLLTGLVVCAVCGGHMVGSSVNGYRVYACAGHLPSSPGHRRRYISADNLEGQVVEQALVMLEGWEAEDARTVPIASPYEVPDPSANSTAPRALIVIRSAAAMDGVVIGPGARFAWNRLSAEHKAAVLRFLFTVIRIGPSTKPRPVFDAGRADIVPAVLRRP